MNYQAEAIRAIEAQQAKVKQPSYQWQVGEQLKDICRCEPRSAELLVQDLKVEAMSIIQAEKKISAFAKKNNGCVTAIDSDRILREFYGLPEPAAAVQPAPSESKPPERKRKIVSMMDFL